MRVVGFILVALGLLGLGWHGFGDALSEQTGGHGNEIREPKQTVQVPPVVSGIAMVSGLILLASAERREEI